MIILLFLLIFLSPRFILFLEWLFNNPRFHIAFSQSSFLLPFIGFLFLPWTTLAYLLAYSPLVGGLTGWGWFWVVLAFIADIGSYGSTRYSRKSTV
jgi:hypothetical protein